MNLETFGGRRFLLITGVQVSITVLLVINRISPEIFSLLTIQGTITYVIGNSYEKKMKAQNGTP